MVIRKQAWIRYRAMCLPIFIVSAMLDSCRTDQEPLAPYAGGPKLSDILVQDSVYVPKVTWIGGYVSVFGVNRGTKAILDSTLVWLAHADGNTIGFPITVGRTPAGAADLTDQYGGHRVDSLTEDNIYTFWLLKADAWSQVVNQPDKQFIVDSAGTALIESRGDTLFISQYSHAQVTRRLDLWVNIKDVVVFGGLARMQLSATNTSDDGILNFTIIQSGAPDSSVSVIGIAYGGQYNINNILWEVLSQDTGSGYGKIDVISSPVITGQQFPGSRVFTAYPAQGLRRNQDYYLWIANKTWNGIGRLRSTPGYGFATFKTW